MSGTGRLSTKAALVAITLIPAISLMLSVSGVAQQVERNSPGKGTPHHPPGGYTVYVVPHSHIDLVWYWDYDKTKVMCLNILRHAMERMKEDPHYTFTQDQTLAIQPFWDSLSEADRDYMREVIGEGRFEVTTGMYVQPDVAGSDFESLTREYLAGMPWLRSTLHATVDTAWNIDTYGQTVQMPQLFHKAGLRYAVFTRDVPESLADSVRSPFVWSSPDGSTVLGYWLSSTYDHSWKPLPEWLSILVAHNVEGNDKLLLPWGGDLYLPEESTAEIEKRIRQAANQIHVPIRDVIFSTPRRYFEQIERSGLTLPRYQMDFNPPQHIQDLRGLYGERPETKLQNRAAEEILETSEKFSSLATLYGQKYPKERLDAAWKSVLFNQDHDALPGSHSDQVDEGIVSRYLGAIDSGRETLAQSLYALSRHISSIGGGDYPFMVFNPLSYRRTERVIHALLFKERINNFEIRDENGTLIPFRIIDASRNGENEKLSMAVVEFEADVPALGYRQFRVRPIDGKANGMVWSAAQNRISNRFFSLQIEMRTGFITSLKDLKTGAELLETGRYLGNELVLSEEKDPDMEGNVHLTGSEIRGSAFKAESISQVSDDLGTTVRVEGPFLGGRRIQEIRLYKDIPRIDFKTDLLGFPGKDGMLEAVFPVRTGTKLDLEYETHNAVTRRPDGIFNAQTWVDAEFDGMGLGLINSGMAGLRTENGVVRMTLLRSVTNYRHYYAPRASEAGSHSFTYSLFPHSGGWANSELVWQAHSFNSPLRVLDTDEHDGSLPASFSFLSVDGNFEVTALKKAESGDALIIRGHETKGTSGPVRLNFAVSIDSALTTNLLENPLGPARLQQRQVEIDCHPFEFVTIRLEGASRLP